jgi:hypothetical protein
MTQKTASNGFFEVKIFDQVHSAECKLLIENVIAKNGFAPEHNYDYFVSYDSKKMKPKFISFGHDRGLFALEWYDHSYQIISEVMAPEHERCNLVISFLNFIFKNPEVKKVLVEFPPQLRKQLLKNIPKGSLNEKSIVVGSILHHFYTPIMALQNWDTELVGSDFSKLRKAKGRFFRNFNVEVLTGEQLLALDISEFEKLVSEWKKGRKSTDTAYFDDYLNFFKSGFKGSLCHIAIKLNGVLCGVSAAWAVPNTNNKTVYYAINLHNYSVSELGDFLTVLFLDELKKQGFEYLDFGSSDEKLLAYKNKFKPIKQYELLCFYIRNEIVKK